MHSRPLTDELVRSADLVVIVTDHSEVDYERVVRESKLVLDSRGVIRKDGKGKVMGLSGALRK
jgi:UDP-N-acetyl-D-mannosaminuronate dehydrogenase